jgi:rhomboid family protein
MNYYRPPSFSIFPIVVKNLLIANLLCFFATFVLQRTYNYDLTDMFGLHYFESSHFKIYQLITYQFLHANIWHIVFNMFALWMFGYMLENFWGPKRFLLFYLVCGIGAGITQEVSQYFYMHHIQQAIDIYNSGPSIPVFNELISKYFGDITGFSPPQSAQEGSAILSEIYKFTIDHSNTIGASGSIFGILLAFGMLFPNTLIYVYFAIPVKAKYFVIFYGLVELYSGIASKPGDNVAHFAHLGGMLFGFFLILYWKRKRLI